MKRQGPEQHPFVPVDGHRGREIEELDDEIREEAYRIYSEESAAGRWRAPQDDWIDAVSTVLERHGLGPPPPHGES